MKLLSKITKDALAALALLVTLVLVGWRCYTLRMIPQNPQHPTQVAFGDFRDVIYWPTRAVMVGVNPYDDRQDGNPARYRERFPAGNNLPPYSPLIFAVGLPFALQPLWLGVVTWWLVNAALTIILAYVAWRWCGRTPGLAMTAVVATVILVSRPGRANLISGQATLLFTLASLAALAFARSRPNLAGAALAIATIKPTFGGPLAILMLARRDWRAALLGLGLGGLAALVGWAILFAPQIQDGTLLSVVRDNQAHTSQEPTFDPQVTTGRLDAQLVVERLLGQKAHLFGELCVPLIILGTASLVLGRVSSLDSLRTDDRSSPEAERLSAALVIVTVAICIYHNIYDGLLLVVPAVVACPWLNRLAMPPWRQLLLFLLLTVPALSSNQVSKLSDSQFESLGMTTEVASFLVTALAVANGLALLAAWILLLQATLSFSRSPDQSVDHHFADSSHGIRDAAKSQTPHSLPPRVAFAQKQPR